MTRAVVLVDGEHYPPVVRDALAALPHDVVGAVLVGGTEKLLGLADLGAEIGVPLASSLEAAIAEHEPDVVVDLSDEPVLDPPARLALAGRALALGVPYEGPDFRFEPPAFSPVDLPALAVVGTGKRVGKTAITCHVASLLARNRSVVVVSMGRGGPPEPELVQAPPTLDDLLARSRSGRHAASDHLETAAFAGVPTVGCRRAGGGLAGAVGVSNVLAGVALAASLRPDLVVLDGSGAALPPVAAGARILVVGEAQDLGVATGYLNGYRHRLADLVVLVSAAPGERLETLRGAVSGLVRPGVPVVAATLRPRPTVPVAGRRVAFFGTGGPAARAAVAAELTGWGADAVSVSGSLSDRRALREELAALDADLVLVELKAAAVDVVVETARARGVEVALVANAVVPLPGERELDAEILRLADLAGASVAEPAR